MKETYKIMINFFRMNRDYDKECSFKNFYSGFGKYIDKFGHYFEIKV